MDPAFRREHLIRQYFRLILLVTRYTSCVDLSQQSCPTISAVCLARRSRDSLAADDLLTKCL